MLVSVTTLLRIAKQVSTVRVEIFLWQFLCVVIRANRDLLPVQGRLERWKAY